MLSFEYPPVRDQARRNGAVRRTKFHHDFKAEALARAPTRTGLLLPSRQSRKTPVRSQTLICNVRVPEILRIHRKPSKTIIWRRHRLEFLYNVRSKPSKLYQSTSIRGARYVQVKEVRRSFSSENHTETKQIADRHKKKTTKKFDSDELLEMGHMLKERAGKTDPCSQGETPSTYGEFRRVFSSSQTQYSRGNIPHILLSAGKGALDSC